MQRVGRDVAVLLGADRVPFAERDLPVVAPTRNARRPALLLAAVHPVRETVVGADVIELRRGLVVPGAPRLTAVHGDHGALVAGEQDDPGVVGVDP